MHLAKDIYKGLLTLFDYKELSSTLAQFPLDPDRTSVYISGLGGSRQEFVDYFFKNVKKLTQEARSRSKLWETVSQRKSKMGKDDDEETTAKREPRKVRRKRLLKKVVIISRSSLTQY